MLSTPPGRGVFLQRLSFPGPPIAMTPRLLTPLPPGPRLSPRVQTLPGVGKMLRLQKESACPGLHARSPQEIVFGRQSSPPCPLCASQTGATVPAPWPAGSHLPISTGGPWAPWSPTTLGGWGGSSRSPPPPGAGLQALGGGRCLTGTHGRTHGPPAELRPASKSPGATQRVQ